MTKHRLQNYLKTHRKRSRLAQHQVAFLLGARGGTKISRYETFSRIPDLLTVFALENIFGIPASELFAGIFEDARCLVEDQAARATRGEDSALASFARQILDPAARPTKRSTTI